MFKTLSCLWVTDHFHRSHRSVCRVELWEYYYACVYPPPPPPPLPQLLPSVISFVSQRSANFALGCNFGSRENSPCLHNLVSRVTVVIQRQAETPRGVNSPSDTVQMKCFCSHSNAISSLATAPCIKVSTGSGVINTQRRLFSTVSQHAKTLPSETKSNWKGQTGADETRLQTDARGAESGGEPVFSERFKAEISELRRSTGLAVDLRVSWLAPLWPPSILRRPFNSWPPSLTPTNQWADEKGQPAERRSGLSHALSSASASFLHLGQLPPPSLWQMFIYFQYSASWKKQQRQTKKPPLYSYTSPPHCLSDLSFRRERQQMNSASVSFNIQNFIN